MRRKVHSHKDDKVSLRSIAYKSGKGWSRAAYPYLKYKEREVYSPVNPLLTSQIRYLHISLMEVRFASQGDPGYLSFILPEAPIGNLGVTILALKEIPGDIREWLPMNKN